jgi:signal transduction histidine kinase
MELVTAARSDGLRRRSGGGAVGVVAWSIAALVVALTAAEIVLLTINGRRGWDEVYGITGVGIVSPLAFAGVGALAASRQPRNAVGWLFLAAGISWALPTAAQQYAIRAFFVAPGTLPGGVVAAWLGTWFFLPIVSLLGIYLPLLFPNGEPPSPRWRTFAWGIGIVAVAALIIDAIPPPSLAVSDNGELQNGALISTASHNGLANIAGLLQLVLSAGALAAIVGLILRYRRSEGELRQQLKWFLFAGSILVLAVIATAFVPSSTPASSIASGLFVVAALGLPAATGIAIFKYHLYDIDLVISRTLVYGALAAFITAVYVGIAVGIGTLVGSGGKPNLGLSILATGIVAVGFQPVRERVQRVANRLVYGKRATPYDVLSQFSERVAESYAGDDVLPRMARVLADATAAEVAEVWLRSGDALHCAAAFPSQPSVPAAVHVNGAAELAIPAADRSVLVRHQGEVLGALTVTKRRGESITPIEVKLMDDLAHQAGLVLRNVGLTADLQARLVDLRASRQRLVAAQDGERRRLERNLHDGAQQYLVAIKVKLSLAEMLTTSDSEKAKAAVVELKRDADEALESLRDLARGIYPPLLAEKGLPTALQAQARKATLPVIIEADGIRRYPQDTEAAFYFCILEALQNIQKYAQASSATVRLREEADQLSVEVADDGRGFDVSTTIRGNGLTNIEDRLDALGGTLKISSSPGIGTTLRATVPVARAMVATAELPERPPANGSLGPLHIGE